MLAATATSGTLLAVLTARHAGFGVSPAVIAICAAVATPLALAGCVERFVHLWRGPPVVTFSPLDSVRCAAADAGAIRAAAQLRGTLGGAGHLYPRRLVVHALACLAAAALGAVVLAVPGAHASPGWSLALVVGAGAGAVLLPARPFYYREAMGGELAVSPPMACATLASRPGRGNSPTPIPTARNATDGRVAQEN